MCAASRAPDGGWFPAPPKVRIFPWRIATNGLATWENKKKRNIVTSDICVVCGMEHEDVFCRRPMVRDLWEAMWEAWPLPPIENFKNTGSEWCLHALNLVPEQQRMMMMMTWWRCWHVNNEMVHHKLTPPIEASRRFLRSYVDSLLCIKQAPASDPTKGKTVAACDHLMSEPSKNRQSALKQTGPRKCSKPPTGWPKLNVDGSWREGDGIGGTGMVLRDEEDMIIFFQHAAISLPATAPLMLN